MQSYWMQMTDTGTLLELRDAPVPEPGPHQLLVRMHAAGLNRGEFIVGHGLHGKPGGWRAIGGEGAGEVVAVGAEVTHVRRGDRVMGRCAGAFSEFAVMEEAEAIPLPSTLSWEEGAGIPLTFLVSYDMLVLQGRLAPGGWLLRSGPCGGLDSSSGATTIRACACSSPAAVGSSDPTSSVTSSPSTPTIGSSTSTS